MGATVWNTTDNTYAKVTAFVDSGELTLDTDIMVNGENYRLYHCKFTATEAGAYAFYAVATMNGAADGVRFLLSVFKNGSEWKRIYDMVAGGINYSPGSGVSLGVLSANDYIEPFFLQTGATIDLEVGPKFMVVKLA